MRRLAPFGLCGLLALVAMAAQAASAQSQPVPLGDQVDQRLQQLRKAQQPGNDPQRNNPLMLTLSELAALRNRLAECWDAPKSVRRSNLVVTMHVKFARDGSLAEPPKVLNSSPDPMFAVAAKSATAAVTKCAPFKVLPVAKYDLWKDIEFMFDPREMFGDKPH